MKEVKVSKQMRTVQLTAVHHFVFSFIHQAFVTQHDYIQAYTFQ